MKHNSVPSVTITELAEELPANSVLLDVRENGEWVAGHAPNARHIPMSELPERLGELSSESELYVVCRSGGRSARVTAFLTAQGWEAKNVDGGMQAWVAAGRPLISEQADSEPEIN